MASLTTSQPAQNHNAREIGFFLNWSSIDLGNAIE